MPGVRRIDVIRRPDRIRRAVEDVNREAITNVLEAGVPPQLEND